MNLHEPPQGIGIGVVENDETGRTYINMDFDSEVHELAIFEELVADLQNAVTVAEHRHGRSMGPEVYTIAITGLASLGGLGGVAAVLRAWFKRHADKEFIFSDGERSVTLKGSDVDEDRLKELTDRVFPPQESEDEDDD